MVGSDRVKNILFGANSRGDVYETTANLRAGQAAVVSGLWIEAVVRRADSIRELGAISVLCVLAPQLF